MEVANLCEQEQTLAPRVSTKSLGRRKKPGENNSLSAFISGQPLYLYGL